MYAYLHAVYTIPTLILCPLNIQIKYCFLFIFLGGGRGRLIVAFIYLFIIIFFWVILFESWELSNFYMCDDFPDVSLISACHSVIYCDSEACNSHFTPVDAP